VALYWHLPIPSSVEAEDVSYNCAVIRCLPPHHTCIAPTKLESILQRIFFGPGNSEASFHPPWLNSSKA